jgi:sugar phosphate isomerase/epimerase
LRQAAKGVPQALEGDVDFAALLRDLDDLEYAGLLSVEYFDLPAMGWGLDDPVAYATALAEQLRPLLGARA